MKGRRKFTSKKKQLVFKLLREARVASGLPSHNQKIFMRSATTKGRAMEPVGRMAGAHTKILVSNSLGENRLDAYGYLHCWEKIFREVDRKYDIRGSVLSHLVHVCISQSGKLSAAHFEYFYDKVTERSLQFTEAITREVISAYCALPYRRIYLLTEYNFMEFERTLSAIPSAESIRLRRLLARPYRWV